MRPVVARSGPAPALFRFPAALRYIDHNAVGVVELHLVVAGVLRFAHPVPAAGGFDLLARSVDVVDLEAEVMHADEVAAAMAGGSLGLVVQQREVDDAVA